MQQIRSMLNGFGMRYLYPITTGNLDEIRPKWFVAIHRVQYPKKLSSGHLVTISAV
jgi:hypothetical protein